MQEFTRQALLELNRRFYQHHATSFSASRQQPWDGWRRIAKRHVRQSQHPLRVLDLGCGNGRLVEFLVKSITQRIVYLGVDTDTRLLTAAHDRLSRLANPSVCGTLVQADATLPSLDRHLGSKRFDLITLFGVMHHIPGNKDRCRLMAKTASLLAPDGVLAVSLWQFPRSGKKIVDWDEYIRQSGLPIDPADLEDGDYLMTWAGDRDNPRYCHFIDTVEGDELTSASRLPRIDRFTADGKDGVSNLYLILRRP